MSNSRPKREGVQERTTSSHSTCSDGYPVVFGDTLFLRKILPPFAMKVYPWVRIIHYILEKGKRKYLATICPSSTPEDSTKPNSNQLTIFKQLQYTPSWTVVGSQFLSNKNWQSMICMLASIRNHFFDSNYKKTSIALNTTRKGLCFYTMRL